jgi:hypothetical protein
VEVSVGLEVVGGMDMDMDWTTKRLGGGVEEMEGDPDVGMSVMGAGVGDVVVNPIATGLRVGRRPPSDICIERDSKGVGG